MTSARHFDGSGSDGAYLAIRDGNNRILLLGSTNSTTLPNQHPGLAYQWQEGATGMGTYLARLSPDGMTVDYTARIQLPVSTTYAGLAAQPDGAPVMAVSYFASDSVLSNVPAQLGVGYGERYAKHRVLIIGLLPSGESTRFSALLGCDGWLAANGMRVDNTGRIWIYGNGSCTELPANAYRSPTATDPLNGFVAVVSSDGQTLEKFAFLGGEDEDSVSEIAFDAQGRPLVCGMTRSAGFPTTPGSFRQTMAGDADGFILRMNSALDGVEQSTFLGGGSDDRITSLRVLPSGSIAFIAQTLHNDFPTTTGAWLPSPRNELGLSVAGRMSASLSQIEMATFLQPRGVDVLAGVDADGRFLLRGSCYSCAGPLFDGAFFQGKGGSTAAYPPVLLRLRSDGSGPDWATHLPGEPALVSLSESAPAGSSGVVISRYARPALPLPVTLPTPGSPATANSGIWLANLDFTGTEPCTLHVSPRSVEVPTEGGVYDLNVDTQPGCIWMGASSNASVNHDWVERSSGIGSAVATIRIPPNNNGRDSRMTRAWVNQTSVDFNQPRKGCTDYTLSPSSLSFGPEGGIRSGEFNIPDMCGWTWHVPEPYVQTTLPTISNGVRKGASALGFTVSVPANRFAARTATLSITPVPLYEEPPNPVPVLTTITQESGPCTATATPGVVIAPAAGGNFQVALATTGTDCQWQAGVANPPETIPIATLTSVPSGSGNATLTVQVDPTPVNTQRTAELLVAGLRVPIQQAGGECVVSIVQTMVEAQSAGGQVSLRVTAQGSACYWNVVSHASWITLPYVYSSGSGTLWMNVAPNPGQTAREGTVTLLGRTITIRQAGTGNALVVISTQPPGHPVTINGVYHENSGTDGISFSFPKGTLVSLSAPATIQMDTNTQRRFSSWSHGNPREFTFTVPETDGVVYYTATYETYVRLTVSYVESRGSYSVEPPSPDGYYQIYLTVRPSATALPGYVFTRWRVDAIRNETSPVFDLRMFQPYSIVPEFVPAPSVPPAEVVVSPPVTKVRYALGSNQRQYTHHLESPNGQATFGQPTVECPGKQALLDAWLFPWATKGRLSVTPISNRANNLSPGHYPCTIKIPRTDGGQPPAISLPLVFEVLPIGGDPEPEQLAVVSGASFEAKPLARGSIASLFGLHLTDETAGAESLPLPTRMGQVEVQYRVLTATSSTFVTAPLFYVSPTQVNLLIPETDIGEEGELQISQYGRVGTLVPLRIASASPAIFTANSDGKGVPAGTWLRTAVGGNVSGDLFICPQDGGSCIPRALDWGGASDELYLTLYVTGLAAGGTAATQVTVDDVSLPVEYAGPQGHFVGLGQVNVRVPRQLRGRGERDLQLTSGGVKANRVKVWF